MTTKRNIILTKEERENILTKFELQFEEVEPNVYKILNTNKVINITELQHKLRLCELMISPDEELRRMEDGYSNTFAKLYYAIIGTDERSIILKYCEIADKECGENILDCYEEKEHKPSIDTLFYV